MIERRRFFAARPVQQVPGPRVELAVQVRKNAAPAPLPPVQPWLSWLALPDEAMAARLLRGDDLADDGDNDLAFINPPSDDGLVHLRLNYPPWERRPEIETGWIGQPWRRQTDDVPLPMVGPDWRCELVICTVSIPEDLDELPMQACYVGAVLGVPPERVRWRLEWEGGIEEGLDDFIGQTDWAEATSAEGHCARAMDAQVLVYPALKGGGGSQPNTLTATAFVDDEPIGALRFIAQPAAW